MRLRYSILLQKARAMMEHTLSMTERTGERSSWVFKAEAAKRGTQYQRMIRRLVDAYAEKYASPARSASRKRVGRGTRASR